MREPIFGTLTILFLLVGAGGDLRGQYVDLREGGRIRLRTVTHSNWVYARFVSLDSSGLRVTRCDSCEIQHFALPQLRSLQASTGRTARSFALEGALLGTVIGAVWGRQTAVHQSDRPTNDILPCTRHCAAVAATVQGGLIGIVIGTTVGALFRHEQWQTLLPAHS